MRVAFSSIVLNTGPSSPGEPLMTRSTSEVAVCCSSASLNSWRASFNSRVSTATVFFSRPEPDGKRDRRGAERRGRGRVSDIRFLRRLAIGPRPVVDQYFHQKVNSTTSGFVRDKQLAYCHCGQCEPGQIQKASTADRRRRRLNSCLPDHRRDVGLWHYPDMPVALANVRSWGQERTWGGNCSRSESDPMQTCAFGLFDHLVGGHKQRGRHRQAERLCRLDVDDRLVLGRRLHRKIGGLVATQDAVDIG